MKVKHVQLSEAIRIGPYTELSFHYQKDAVLNGASFKLEEKFIRFSYPGYDDVLVPYSNVVYFMVEREENTTEQVTDKTGSVDKQKSKK